MRAFDREESERYGNGDMLKWQEVEADKARGPLPDDCKGAGDPDPKYDLAPMVEKQTFAEMVFLQQLDKCFKDM